MPVGTFQFGVASHFDAISEINKKGIQFIGSRYVYFKTTAERTQIGGELYVAGTLDVTGTASKPGGGSWATLSDIRIKDIKGDFTDSLSKLKMINPIVFTYKKDELKEVGEQQGVIAQELEKVFPYMVTEGQKTFEDGETIDDFKTINTSPLIYVCVNAIKELSDKVDKLEKKISDMGK